VEAAGSGAALPNGELPAANGVPLLSGQPGSLAARARALLEVRTTQVVKPYAQQSTLRLGTRGKPQVTTAAFSL